MMRRSAMRSCLEERLRVRDLMQPAEHFVDFYARVLPRQVSSAASPRAFYAAFDRSRSAGAHARRRPNIRASPRSGSCSRDFRRRAIGDAVGAGGLSLRARRVPRMARPCAFPCSRLPGSRARPWTPRFRGSPSRESWRRCALFPRRPGAPSFPLAATAQSFLAEPWPQRPPIAAR